MSKENLNTILIIKNENGYNRAKFLNVKNNVYEDIETISKENIIELLEFILNNETNIQFCDETTLPNPAQRIIYKNLYEKFNDIIKNKSEILKDIDKKFAEAEQKYNK